MDNIIIDISDNHFEDIDLENCIDFYDINNNIYQDFNDEIKECTAIFNSLKIINTNQSDILDCDNNFSFYQGPFPSKYKDNFYHCYACNKKMIISKNELDEFFQNNLEKRINRKNLILMYRLFDECKFYIKFQFITKFDNIIKNIKTCCTYNGSSEWNMIYEMYFNQQGLDLFDYTYCNICNYKFCPKHCDIAKFKYFKCKNCSKNLNVCNWCKIGYEDNLCYICS
jgi:hypothetical protein